MKNKTKPIFVKIACVLLAFSAATFSAACSSSDRGDNNENQNVANQEQQSETNSPLTKLVNGFEDSNEYYKFSASDRFGKLSQNTDKNYVTEGKASLKVEAYGDYSTGGTAPTAQLALAAKGYADLSKFKSVTFDIFNASETEKEIGVSITIDGLSTKEQTFLLQSGKNSISYSPVVKYLSIASELTKGETLNIVFPKADKAEQKAQVFFLDNVRLNSHIKAFKPVEMMLDENEFCSFDKEYQEYVVTSIGVGPCTGCLPELSVNADPVYTKNGQGKSLKVVLPTGTAPLNDGWPGIYFIPAYYKNFDFVELKESKAYLVFDVYNDGAAFTFNVEFSGENRYTTALYQHGFVVERGWTEVRVPLEYLDQNVSESRPIILSENLASIGIVYSKFAGAAKTMYFDNFRIEK